MNYVLCHGKWTVESGTLFGTSLSATERVLDSLEELGKVRKDLGFDIVRGKVVHHRVPDFSFVGQGIGSSGRCACKTSPPSSPLNHNSAVRQGQCFCECHGGRYAGDNHCCRRVPPSHPNNHNRQVRSGRCNCECHRR